MRSLAGRGDICHTTLVSQPLGSWVFYFFSSSWLSVAEVLWNFPLPVLAGHQGEERTLHATFGK